MTSETKCSICDKWFNDQDYQNHLPCEIFQSFGSSGESSKDILDKYSKRGTGRP